MSEEVKIDWSPATDDQLSELYDALYERNGLLAQSLDSMHFRVNLGTRSAKVEAFKDDILHPTKALVDSILDEISRRRRQRSGHE
jgi:hypothetical protein